MSEAHSELRNTMRAYAGFQMATALFIVSNPSSFPLMAFILPMFAVSIPSTIAYASLARLTPEDEARNPNPISAISQLLTHIPCLTAISLILWPSSHAAALIFLATAAAWVFFVVRLRRQHG
jgi:hypothetical protein